MGNPGHQCPPLAHFLGVQKRLKTALQPLNNLMAGQLYELMRAHNAHSLRPTAAQAAAVAQRLDTLLATMQSMMQELEAMVAQTVAEAGPSPPPEIQELLGRMQDEARDIRERVNAVASDDE